MQLEQTTKELLKNPLNKAKILVVGDVMLDKYWFSDVKRISPEAPVPIAKVNKVELRPGGAANVAYNISSLGGNVSLLSVTGNDENAQELEQILKKQPNSIQTILKQDSSIHTIVKLRVIAKNQQLIRVDFEEEPTHEVLAMVLDDYKNMVKNFDIVILSDYGKGGLSHTKEMINIANQANIPILVDPKGNDYTRYKNATLLTPNKSEFITVAGEFTNEEELQQKALTLTHQLSLQSLLITRGEDGMTLLEKEHFTNYKTMAQEVYDVSGAGDTVIASLALMLANKVPLADAVNIANHAAGIVVGKLGTASITKEELLTTLSKLI